MRNILLAVLAASIPLVMGHACFWDPSMLCFNCTDKTFSYDNRPVAPLADYTFEQWWFHGHLGYPPNSGDFLEFPAGGSLTGEIACNKGATKYWASSEGRTYVGKDNYPCPGYPTSQFHGINDLKGCAFSIAYKSDFNSVQPEDLVVFTVNHTCVWTVLTEFQVPADMPPCPEGGCICAWHWIHSVDSGSEQMYMNGYRCKITNSTSTTPLQKPVVPVRCTNNPSACNQGAQQPLYWFQAERNNMFNDQYDPPYYLDEWGFKDGAQNGIFDRSGNVVAIEAPSSTPTNKPSSTPSGNGLSSTPAGNRPSSSPPAVNKYLGGASSLSPSPSSPAPSPTNSGQESDPKSNTLSSNQPQPSKKSCKGKNQKKKKRQEAVAQHLKHKRHAGGHNH